MTNDLYGSQAHDHEDSADTEHGENQVHEAPSDFEFSDPAEHVILENETDSQAALSGDTQTKSRSPLLPIAAAAGGILLLGGIALWQFGGSSAPPPMPMVSTMPSLATAQSDASVAVTPKTGASSVEISAAPTPQVPVPVTPQVVAAPATASAPVPVVPVESAIATMPSQPSVPVSSIPAPHPVSAVSGEPTETRIAALSARIDSLQKALDQSNQQLAQMTNVVAASASESGGKDLQDRLDKIEQELMALNAKPVTSSVFATRNQKKTITAPAPSRHKIVPHKTVPKVAEKPIEETHWVLRAASPGQAWVASSSTSSDLKDLHVGDSLAGIGRVTAIEQKDGAWIVQGTSGTIQ